MDGSNICLPFCKSFWVSFRYQDGQSSDSKLWKKIWKKKEIQNKNNILFHLTIIQNIVISLTFSCSET